MIPTFVTKYLFKNGYGRVRDSRPVGGGCINNGARITTEKGATFFLKTNAHSPADMFAREAEGLEALDREGGPRVPEVFLFGDDFILLEDLAPAGRREDYWPSLGRQMAALHGFLQPNFGFSHDNYIGSTPQPNNPTADGFKFFAEYRLGFQARLAAKRRLLSNSEMERIVSLARKLRELVPEQPASIIHGDLWSGNIISDSVGSPAIIDPAAYYGWAEADLAMMVLFGNPPESFFEAYTDVRPLHPHWRSRFPIYNLYHLLNHLNLFGRGYYGQVMGIVRRFE